VRAVEWRVLGPLEVVGDGRPHGGSPVELGGPKQRAVLALLIAAAGRTVSVDRLVDEVWGEDPPPKVMSSLQAYVANLRRAVEPDRPARAPAALLVTRPPGYALLADPACVDAAVFGRRAALGHDLLATEPAVAAAELEAALALWRGDAYADVAALAPSLAAESTRLEQLRLLALEDRWQAEVDLGAHARAVPELEALLAGHPLRERAWCLLALALYRSQRQADALGALARARTLLAEELGLDPGEALRRLEEQVLRQDPELTGPPAAAHRAVPTASLASRPAPPAGPSELPPAAHTLVGRDAPLAALAGAFVDAAAGRGRLVLVSGEAGIGKTRLAEAAVATATAMGLTTAWGRAEESGAAPPLWPWTEALPALVAGEPREAESTFRLAERLTSLLAEEGPLLVVLDDVHWADRDTLRLLRHVGPALRELPAVVLVTLRESEADWGPSVADALGELARTGPLRLPLTGLSAEEVAHYVASRHGTVAPEVARALRERTEGNPFYVGQLVDLLESDHRLADAPSVAALQVPDGVRDVVRQRLARLPDAARSLLTTASVVGRSFDLDVVEEAGDLDEEALLDGLEAVLLSGLVVDDADGRYRFVHALVQEAVYQRIPAPRRARRHAMVAAAITGLRPDADRDHAAEVAAHHARAGAEHVRRAWEWAVRAAEQARRSAAPEECARWFGEAAELVGRDRTAVPADRHALAVEHVRALVRAGKVVEAWDVVVSVGRDALDAGDVLATAELAVSVDSTLWNWRQYGYSDPEAVRLLEDLLGVVSAGDPIDEPVLRARLLVTLAMEVYWVDPARSERLVDEALAAAPDDGRDPRVLAMLEVAHLCCQRVPLTERRVVIAERLVQGARASGDREAEARGLLLRGSDLLGLGRFAQGWADLAAARDLAARIGLPTVDVIARYGELLRPLAEGDRTECERLLREVTAIHRRTTIVSSDVLEPLLLLCVAVVYGDADLLERCASVMPPSSMRDLGAYAEVLRGRPEVARSACPPFAETGAVPGDFLWLYITSLRALLRAAVGDVEACHALLAELEPYRDRPVWAGTGIGLLGWTTYPLGLLRRAVGDLEGSVCDLREALARSEEHGWHAFVVHAAHQLSRTLALRGAPGDAEEALALAARAVPLAERLGIMLPPG
jgi:DNA-binding SARP family transcriptional activator